MIILLKTFPSCLQPNTSDPAGRFPDNSTKAPCDTLWLRYSEIPQQDFQRQVGLEVTRELGRSHLFVSHLILMRGSVARENRWVGMGVCNPNSPILNFSFKKYLWLWEYHATLNQSQNYTSSATGECSNLVQRRRNCTNKPNPNLCSPPSPKDNWQNSSFILKDVHVRSFEC